MLKISEYIDAIEAEIKRWDVPTVLFNPSFKDEKEVEALVTPAVFILCDAIGESGFSSSGNGSLSEPVEIELVCVISSSETTADKDIFNFASFIKRKTNANNWRLGDSCSFPKNVAALNTTGKQKGLKEWRVSFIQEVEVDPQLSEPEYDFDGLYLGINPKTDEDYKLVEQFDVT
jgi:hypothetical protein